MSSIEVRDTNSAKYPKSITYSLPLGEVQLPAGIEIKPQSRFVTRTQWLGSVSESKGRDFFEQTRVTQTAEGSQVTPDDERAILLDSQIPNGPDRWKHAVTLYTRKDKALAVVEFPFSAEISQSRVTTITKKDVPPDGSIIVVSSPEQLVGELETLGFPEHAFDYLKTGQTRLEEKTGGTAAFLRATEPLAKVVGALVTGALKPLERKIWQTEGTLIESVRTPNHSRSKTS